MQRILAAIGLGILVVWGLAPSGKAEGPTQPDYGVIQLSPEFEPNSYELAVVAGGAESMAELSANDTCSGWTDVGYDIAINYASGYYGAGPNPLRFSLVAPEGATIAVAAPDGVNYCNEQDAAPTVTISAPLAGVYLVWVGAPEEAMHIEGRLLISELTGEIAPAD